MIHYEDNAVTLYAGDCLNILRDLPDNSVDAVITDPPYGLEFMGKEWDRFGGEVLPVEDTRLVGRQSSTPFAGGSQRVRYGAPGRSFGAWCQLWTAECLRVLKPGGHLLAFGGTRTWHRLAVAVEEAGFEMRDSIAWLYGSGFPKSLDVSKAIDKRGGRPDLDQTIGAAIKAARESRGWTTGQADRHFCGGSTNWTWYEGRKGMCRPPAPADFARIIAEWPELAPLAAQVAEAERDVVGSIRKNQPGGTSAFAEGGIGAYQRGDISERAITGAPATDDARRWQGWGTAMKPAHEPVVHAVKPYAVRDILAGIGSHLTALEQVCESTAKPAAPSSAPIQAASPVVSPGSAPAPAATQPEDEHERPTATGAAVGSSAVTVTSASASTVETFSNTVTSWRASWAAICEATSRSTTGTTTRPTTDLTTLSSCLSQITHDSTAWNTSGQGPSPSLVEAADCLFAASVLSSRSTLALSATESATSATPRTSPDEAATSSSAFEPVVVARKPLAGTVAGNVLAWGTGALNIDATRVGIAKGDKCVGGAQSANDRTPDAVNYAGGGYDGTSKENTQGRWPANVVLDEDAAAELARQSGVTTSVHSVRVKPGGVIGNGNTHGAFVASQENVGGFDDTGGASRFFYVAKAPTRERPKGDDGTSHPTVKPLALMRWLVRLVTPPGGVVLEPFAGSGTTVEACLLEGFRCIAIEREASYLPLIEQRIRRVVVDPPAPPADAA